jgi:ubiquinone/menaquinone biosynthesis C-methylase UbiE
MPDKIWNLAVWDRSYAWPKDGDEWDDSARFCGVPYEKWKDSLARTFLIANLRPNSEVLEIGPGHGRWSALIPHRIPKGTLHLIDLSPSCIEFCKKRLEKYRNVEYHVNDGRTIRWNPADLSGFSGFIGVSGCSGVPMDGPVNDSSIDFVFSIDTFVHIEEPEVRSYAKELYRVMKPQSMGAIHHPGNPTPQQRQNGMRSMVDSRKFAQILSENGLHVIRQTSEWGTGSNMALTGDAITVFARP